MPNPYVPPGLPGGGIYFPGEFTNQPPSGPPPATQPSPPSSNGNLGGSPGLVTSTGGIFGEFPALITPTFDTKNQINGCFVTNPQNFDTEADGFYYFPNQEVVNCAGKPVTINNIVIEYREIGLATFRVGVIVYVKDTDSFKFVEKTVKLLNTSPRTDRVNFTFPDGQIHTKKISLIIDGERPQPYISRVANSGPLSIISLTMVGVADVSEIL